MVELVHIDRHWLAARPLPVPDKAGDKDERGRVLIAGGAEFVPGALRLTGEAVLRSGAGKVQLATVRSAALSVGVLIPEAAMIALPADADGEIAAEAADILAERLSHCDTLILGPGMSISDRTDQLVAKLLAVSDPGKTVVLDAAALTSARNLAAIVSRHNGRVIMTPHHGEMAHLAGVERSAVDGDPCAYAVETARRFNAVVLLKGKSSLLVDPAGNILLHEGGCAGLGTGGSGDVLAGIIGGLAARGAAPILAAAWGAWLHGRAGEILAGSVGEIGFLARELLPLIPSLLSEPESNDWPDADSSIGK